MAASLIMHRKRNATPDTDTDATAECSIPYECILRHDIRPIVIVEFFFVRFSAICRRLVDWGSLDRVHGKARATYL